MSAPAQGVSTDTRTIVKLLLSYLMLGLVMLLGIGRSDTTTMIGTQTLALESPPQRSMSR